MRHHPRLSPLQYGVHLGVLCLGLSALAADFEAGLATIDITPPAGWRRAGGYSEFISKPGGDPLLAKAMVLSQGETTIALVGNDLTSVPRELTDRARKLASRQTGIPIANIVITATHTHGGPEYYGPLRDFLHARAMKENQGHDPREPLDFYIPTRRAFQEGHYEPTTCPLEPGCGERLVQAAVNLLHKLKPRTPSTSNRTSPSGK
jgi:hypothetical protein